ncbi:hypothetical protein BRADI_1g74135v3 [Brachypodium distachyon]|uniref:GTD-binding domain-containing protein n=1 Tax=Brachypodium distachyon TaxID=15368 RepID=A0A0Q3K0X2_BRADI|nr:hypothetical protein BRADI_1g74135v3 [Brachypodium distachyon]
MAVKARARSREFSRQFWSVLRHALSECFLIVMLLVVAVVSYTATKFAHICRIRSPCMLCSRLDQVLHGKAWFSEESICAAHSKLAHSDDLCEKFFLSCSESVRKPGNLKNMSVKEKVNSRLRFRHTELCSCCSKPFKKKRDAHRLSEEVSDMFLDDSMSKVKERSIAMASVGCSSDDDVDQLPHGCYRKLSADHDSESEIRISDDDDGCLAMVYEAKQRTRDKPCADAWLQPMITSTNTLSPSPSESTDQTKFMSITPLVPLDTAEGTTNAAKSSDPAIGDGLEEINWGQPNVSNNNLDVQLNTVPEQDCQELQKEKRSPDEEATKIFATSAYDGTSSTADPQHRKKTFLSQLSSARCFDGPWSEVSASPRISIQIDEYSQSDATGSRQFLDLEPTDAHVTSEDEGEISLELSKKKLSVLYKDEAMAMINRLQQDKAAMHMEAMQYLRMMEEQADHDQEAIEKLNDLLTEREKEILDLEAELDNYQIKYSDESFDVRKFDATDGDAKILESLSRLEETLGMPSTNRFDMGGTNDNLQNGTLRDHPTGDGQYVENSELESQCSQLLGEHLNDEPVTSVPSQRNVENQSSESEKDFDSSRLDDDQISSITSIRQEISLLNSRFKALEADQKFLKQILGSLKCSSDGLQYMQEITSHLRQLRRMMTEQRDRTVL